MKFRIIGTILVLAILAALFIVTQDPGNQQPTQQTNVPNDTGLQPLKIN